MIYTLVSAGLGYHEACNLPITKANEIIACHWQAQGLLVERMACKDHGIGLGLTREQKFAEISNRQKSWPLELL